MNLSLLAPAGLVALAALVLPLLLHLQRQSQARPTPFAALRWIGTKLRPRRRVRFEEILLLLLRLLLVACVALLFAQPVITGASADKPWVLVTATLDPVALRNSQRLKTPAEAQWHWLAPSFPLIDAPRPSPSQPLSSLLRDIDARLPARTPVIVLVPDSVDGLDGERMQLSRDVDWRSVASLPMASKNAPASAKPTLLIRNSKERSEDLRYLQAAARALGRTVDSADSASALPAGTKQMAWLASGAVPVAVVAWLRSGGLLILDAEARIEGVDLAAGAPVWRDRQGRVLARESTVGRGRVVQLQAALTAQAIPQVLDASFPDQLESWLEPVPTPSRATAASAKPRTGGPGYRALPEPIDRWLVLLALVLLLIERLLATRAKRGLAP